MIETPPTSSGYPPIFIVGCQRSGTTLFRLILDSHPNISCGPETRFLIDMAKITADREWPRMSRYGLNKQWWYRHIGHFFDEFQKTYAQARGRSRWADKTPVYALHLDFIGDVFPDCLVINVVRNPFAVARSHRDTWGIMSALRSVGKWVRYVEAAERFGHRVGSIRYLRVRYEDLTEDLRKEMSRVMEFLGEPWDDALLHHRDFEHDVMPSHEAHARRRRVDGNSVFRSSIKGRGFNPALDLLVRVRAGSTLRKLGY
jgi:hypothetical protein